MTPTKVGSPPRQLPTRRDSARWPWRLGILPRGSSPAARRVNRYPLTAKRTSLLCSRLAPLRSDTVRIVRDAQDEVPDAPRLEALSPKFRSSEHGTYVAALEHALDHQPAARNIALAGPYGVGKSSVLGELARRRKRHVINVSLLTFGVDPEPVPAIAETNPVANTTSNRIQKEIVKQLLYQQSPARTRQSRFRRIDRPHWRRELLVALGGGALVLAAAIISGLGEPLLNWLHVQLPTVSEGWRVGTLTLIAFAAAATVVLIIRTVVRGRIGIEKVSAGPATISLPARSTSYFDEYLDEIIYFFEVGRRDIVIIEDLDRFDNSQIYESLRSLNALLNSAHQLQHRNIRFIYAVRDSIFEHLGVAPPDTDAALPDDDQSSVDLIRGNRTKFFELIIPMVPFITHKNARDLLLRALTDRGHGMPRDLLDIAARHVPDMRLIHNIVNEYEVFRRILLDTPIPVPELTEPRLFALMLVKNTQAGEFERIRHGTSRLDELYRHWRDFVTANIDSLRADNDRLQNRISRRDAAEEYALRLAGELRSRINVLADATGSGLTESSIRLAGSPVEDAQLQTAQFWRDLRLNNTALTLTAAKIGTWSSQTMELTPEAIEVLTGMPLQDETYLQTSTSADRATIARNEGQLRFLRRHNWQQLMRRSDFSIALRDGTNDSPATFRTVAERTLRASLVVELVESGYITEYFPLHVSAFYGELIRPDAMTYIMRNIDKGVADAEYPLEPADVDAILADQGKSVLGEASMRNVSIVDHVLRTDSSAAESIIQLLPSSGDDGVEFVHRYITAGSEPDLFIAALAPHAGFIFSLLADATAVELTDRARLFSVAVEHRTDRAYRITDSVRSILETHAALLPALTESDSTPAAKRVVQFLIDTGTVLPEVSALSGPVRECLRETRAWRFNAANVARLTGAASLSLDDLHECFGAIYEYAIDEPDRYRIARTESPDPGPTVTSSSMMAMVLSDVAAWTPALIDDVVAQSLPACRVEDLSTVPATTWSALLKYRRCAPTAKNLIAYFAEEPTVNAAAAALLNDIHAITNIEDADQTDLEALALAIINAAPNLISVDQRIQLALSLSPGVLPTEQIAAESGPLIGALLRAGLIADDEAAFAARLMLDWETQEAAILHSAAFHTFVGPDVLASSFLEPALRSERLSAEVRTALARALDEWSIVLPGVFQAMADSALRGRILLPPKQISALPSGGVPPATVLDVLAQAGDRIPLEALQSTLRQLGEPYSLIADHTRRRPRVRAAQSTMAVLDRLKDEGIVSGVQPAQGGWVRVSMHHP